MTQIDLLIWPNTVQPKTNELGGEIIRLPADGAAVSETLKSWATTSSAVYGLLWSGDVSLPDAGCLLALIAEGIDIAHAGLRLEQANQWPDLCLVLQDWSMIPGSPEQPSSSWRVSSDLCLIRREMALQIGGWDGAFVSRHVAALEFGYRAMRLGALVEYRPELLPTMTEYDQVEPPRRDFYAFILRHFGRQWGRYVWMRRSLRRMGWWGEWRAWQEAEKACTHVSPPLRQATPVWYDPSNLSEDRLKQIPVTVIIPTLGRYPYLPQALDSLRQQTVRPREVIVVDQNPPEQRQPETYVGYEDLTLQVIWQDERGQSLARNTGLAAATSPYVFLFDDDSIADPDLIAAHLRLVLNGRCHVSTGVAFPPPPSNYQLPPYYRYTRLAQTFDTGNSLLPLDLARKMGGLDRNYDFGPGTDNDFGTRLYLAGYRIAHNPQARRIHFKAPMGGLRAHGARKYNTDAGLWQPYPPITLSYYGLRYLTRQQQRERTLISFIASKIQTDIRKNRRAVRSLFIAIMSLGVSILFLPWKWRASLRQARLLLDKGVCLATFPVSDQTV
jgi:GT2 family glycosyltransferase